MKIYAKIVLIISTLLLGVNIYYVFQIFDSMNILQYLLAIGVVPYILLSIVVASVLFIANVYELKQQAIFSAVAAGLLSTASFVYNKFDTQLLNRVLENSKNLTQNYNLEISNIHISNNVSSYVLFFCFIFVLVMVFNFIYKKLNDQGMKKDV